MKKFFYTIVVLICCNFKTAFCDDPTKFLSSFHGIQVIQEDGQPKVFRHGGDEKYFAQDTFGNRYMIRIAPQATLIAELSASAILEACGVPNISVYPILLKRGKFGIPDSKTAAALGQTLDGQETRWGKIGSDGDWFSATIQGLGQFDRLNPRKLHELGAQQVAELLFLSIIVHTTGMHEFDPHNSFVMVNGHVTMLNLADAFKTYRETSRDKRAFFFHMNALSEFLSDELIHRKDIKTILYQLNIFLGKLELLVDTDLDTLISLYAAIANRSGPYKNMPHFDFQEEFRWRALNARAFLKAFLAPKEVPPAVLRKLRASPVQKPFIRLPRPIENGSAPHTATEALWLYYFKNTRSKRDVERAWPVELGEDPISLLLERAQREALASYFVAPFMAYQHAIHPDISYVQTTKNARSSKTLIAVPTNDTEATRIIEIAIEAGANVLPVDVQHGAKLTASLAKKIIEAANGQGCNQIVIVELPGETAEIEAKLQEAQRLDGSKFNIITVDHHKYPNLDRSSRFSSLEQVATVLGYKLAPRDHIISVADKHGFAGVVDLGLSKERIQIYLNHQPEGRNIKALAKQLKSTKAQNSPLGPIFFLESEERISELAPALALNHYPTIPNVFVVHPGISVAFSGHPQIVALLEDTFRPIEQGAKHFSGGSHPKSQFWGFVGVPEDKMSDTVDLFKKAHKRALTLEPDSCHSFFAGQAK